MKLYNVITVAVYLLYSTFVVHSAESRIKTTRFRRQTGYNYPTSNFQTGSNSYHSSNNFNQNPNQFQNQQAYQYQSNNIPVNQNQFNNKQDFNSGYHQHRFSSNQNTFPGNNGPIQGFPNTPNDYQYPNNFNNNGQPSQGLTPPPLRIHLITGGAFQNLMGAEVTNFAGGYIQELKENDVIINFLGGVIGKISGGKILNIYGGTIGSSLGLDLVFIPDGSYSGGGGGAPPAPEYVQAPPQTQTTQNPFGADPPPILAGAKIAAIQNSISEPAKGAPPESQLPKSYYY